MHIKTRMDIKTDDAKLFFRLLETGHPATDLAAKIALEHATTPG